MDRCPASLSLDPSLAVRSATEQKQLLRTWLPQGSGLPSMLQSKLNAPRVLRVNKVADYVIKKMADQGISLREEPLFWDAAKQQEWEAQQAAAAGAGPGGLGGSGGAAARESGGGSAAQSSGGSRFSIRQLYSSGGSASPPAGQQQANPPLLITCNGMVRGAGSRVCLALCGGASRKRKTFRAHAWGAAVFILEM
jgi:hypothetical protein